MRSYRMFTNVTSVAFEWRIKGFRIRVLLFLFALLGLVGGTVLLPVSAVAGAAVWVVTLILSFAFATYVYRVDPDLVLGEITLIKLLINGLRHRYRTNEAVGD